MVGLGVEELEEGDEWGEMWVCPEDVLDGLAGDTVEHIAHV